MRKLIAVSFTLLALTGCASNPKVEEVVEPIKEVVQQEPSYTNADEKYMDFFNHSVDIFRGSFANISNYYRNAEANPNLYMDGDWSAGINSEYDNIRTVRIMFNDMKAGEDYPEKFRELHFNMQDAMSLVLMSRDLAFQSIQENKPEKMQESYDYVNQANEKILLVNKFLDEMPK